MDMLASFFGSLTGHAPSTGNANKATVLFGFSFGYDLDGAGTLKPGSVNERIAETILDLSKSQGINKILAQEEVAIALQSMGHALPREYILTSFLPSNNGGTRTTEDMWKGAIDQGLLAKSDVVMPVAQSYHLSRVLYLGQSYASCVRMPDHRKLRDFATDSRQQWTTSLTNWRIHEIKAYWQLWHPGRIPE